MIARTASLRQTVLIVFAFLFIVALFLSPGGAAEQATDQLTAVATKAPGKRTVPSSHAADHAARAAWFEPAAEHGAIDPAPHGAEGFAVPAPVPGDLPMVDLDPPPRGPDFPENS